jgi:hypothetical protein
MKHLAPALLLALALPALAAAEDDRLPEWQAKALPLIKPTQKDLVWKKVPWLTDLDAAVKAAKQEKRPILLWTAGDDPLERC